METSKTYRITFYFSADVDDYTDIYMKALSAESLTNDLLSILTTSKAVSYSKGDDYIESMKTIMTSSILRFTVETAHSDNAMELYDLYNYS